MQLDIVYEYLRQNYADNEPIFLADIQIPDMKDVSIRQQIKKLTTDGRLKRFDTGIYYFPKKSMFRSGSMLSVDEVIKKKYLMDGEKLCGYVSGMLFANQIGITTQVPMVYEVYTNKATTEYRETRLADIRILLRRPYVSVNDKNAAALQFLDLLKEIVDIAEVSGFELTERLLRYMKKKDMGFDSINRTLYIIRNGFTKTCMRWDC